MTKNSNGEHTSLVDGIFSSDSSYEAPPPPPKKEFLPWHRPRKQFVRHYQWCREVKRISQISPPHDNTLKYLGLPGPDLLDLRYIYQQVCEQLGLGLKFLGFNSSANPESKENSNLNISLDEVLRYPNVDIKSEVIPDNFEQLANQKSLAFRKAKSLGPFDVINLDLCDGFANHAPASISPTHYSAVRNLLAIQARNPNPWTLLITTRVDHQNIHQETLEIFKDEYIRNFQSCQKFKEVSQASFNINSTEEIKSSAKTSPNLPAIYLSGIAKWLIGLALAQTPKSEVTISKPFGYRVLPSSANEDLISLCFKITPSSEPYNDPMGLAENTCASMLNECELAARAASNIAKRIDIDQKLLENIELNSRMIEATKLLLSSARYNIEDYDAWARSETQSQN